MSVSESTILGINDGPFAKLIKEHLSDEEWNSLVDDLHQIVANPSPSRMARLFATISRRIKAADVSVSLGELKEVGPNDVPLVVKDWSLIRLIRVWILMCIPSAERAVYVKLIEQLFMYGEVEELVALYSALPVYHYPDVWHQRCAEGVRSNIGSVRQAVLIDNYYPSLHLDEGSWNQLVLKGFFTDEYMPGIVGLAERNNKPLAHTLVDFAYERSAAQRAVSPVLWVLVAPYLNERAFSLMSKRIMNNPDEEERQAIIYAFDRSEFGPAREFMAHNIELKEGLNIADKPWANIGV